MGSLCWKCFRKNPRNEDIKKEHLLEKMERQDSSIITQIKVLIVSNTKNFDNTKYEEMQNIIELRPIDLGIALAVLNIKVNVYILDNHARIVCEYLIYNNTSDNLNSFELLVKKPNNSYANNLMIYNHDELSLNITNNLGQPFLSVEPKDLQEEKFSGIFQKELNISNSFKLIYEFFMELEVINNEEEGDFTNQICKLVIPSNIYVYIIEDILHLPESLINKAHTLRDVYLGKWEIQIKRFNIKGCEVGDLYTTSNHKLSYKSVNNLDCQLNYFDQYNPRSRSDLIVEYKRKFSDSINKPYILSREQNQDSCYFYFKSYPNQQINNPNIKKNSNNNLIEEVNGDVENYYTIYIDLGEEMFNSKFNYSKEYALAVLNRLPNNSFFRIVALPAEGIYYENEDEFPFIKGSLENINNEITRINKLKPTFEKSVIEDYINYKRNGMNSNSHNGIHFFIFISKVKPSLVFDNIYFPKINMKQRYYFISIDNELNNKLDKIIENELSGFSVKTKFEIDIESNVDRIMKSSLEPYIYYNNFIIPDTIINELKRNRSFVRDRKYKNGIRGVNDGIELFFKLNLNNFQENSSIPLDLEIEYIFNGQIKKIHFSLNMSAELNDEHLEVEKLYLANLFESSYINLSNNNLSRVKLDAINNISNYMFSLYYGDEYLGEKSWRIDISMEVVKTEILENFKQIQNPKDSDWSSEGNQLEFNMKLFELVGKDNLGRDITIKKPSTNSAPNIHQVIMGKVNKKKLLVFDEQFIFIRLKVDKKLYAEFLSKLKEGSKKLFKNAFNKIEDTNTKNLAFTIFAIAYLEENYSHYKKDYEKDLKKIIKNLQDEYEYDEKFQKEANAIMTEIVKSNLD